MWMSPRITVARRIIQLLVGLVAYGIAISLMLQAGIGVAPWDVLTQGLAKRTGIDFGWMTNIIGVLLVGPSAQLGLWLFPPQHILALQVLSFAGGLLLLGLATGLYIGARMGPGPRDGLMTGIHARTGWRLWKIRTAIEITVLLTGWALGGNFGAGTIVFAVLIGPIVAVTIPRLRVPQPRACATVTRDIS
jgi:uncharacterized membrane protein YczE